MTRREKAPAKLLEAPGHGLDIDAFMPESGAIFRRWESDVIDARHTGFTPRGLREMDFYWAGRSVDDNCDARSVVDFMLSCLPHHAVLFNDRLLLLSLDRRDK